MFVILQCGGWYQSLLQNSNDNETYYEACLKGILVWCASCEQLTLTVPNSKSPQTKQEFMLEIVEMWDEGCNVRDRVVVVEGNKLTEDEQKCEGAFLVRDRHGCTRKILGIMRCEVFGSAGNFDPNSSQLLVIESLFNGSKLCSLQVKGTGAMKGKLKVLVEVWEQVIGNLVYERICEYFGIFT
ncbi:hypothetical protein BC830DRAFT_1076764 [Chytriomyces sp. MP71]|nr:hypothetical protein BC830DRAFT_1076764 [Chytriomyces sp. MP71]